jgi:phosphoglycolate phosphatase-like HAD superfamily hydrolase
METKMPKAAIFDVDGTLLDSVDLHAMAWHDAMIRFGHDVSFEQARSQIGKGGDKLIPVFLSESEQRDHGEELNSWRSKHFKANYLPLVRPFSAVPELLQRSRDSGVRIAIASSAKKDELEKYLNIAGVRRLTHSDRVFRRCGGIKACAGHLSRRFGEAGHRWPRCSCNRGYPV